MKWFDHVTRMAYILGSHSKYFGGFLMENGNESDRKPTGHVPSEKTCRRRLDKNCGVIRLLIADRSKSRTLNDSSVWWREWEIDWFNISLLYSNDSCMLQVTGFLFGTLIFKSCGPSHMDDRHSTIFLDKIPLMSYCLVHR